MLVPKVGTHGGDSSNRNSRADVLTNKEGGGQAKASHVGGRGGIQEYLRKALPTLGEGFPL